MSTTPENLGLVAVYGPLNDDVVAAALLGRDVQKQGIPALILDHRLYEFGLSAVPEPFRGQIERFNGPAFRAYTIVPEPQAMVVATLYPINRLVRTCLEIWGLYGENGQPGWFAPTTVEIRTLGGTTVKVLSEIANLVSGTTNIKRVDDFMYDPVLNNRLTTLKNAVASRRIALNILNQ